MRPTIGARACTQTCHVTAIDLRSRLVLWEQHCEDTAPQSMDSSSSSEGVGSKPTDQVLDFLQGLPRQ